MSNHAKRNPAAASGKIKRLKAQLTQEQQMSSSVRMSLLNMRQMYEGAVQEKQQLQDQVRRYEMLVAALVLQEGKKGKLVLTDKTMTKLPKGGNLEFSKSERPQGTCITFTAADVPDEVEEDDEE